MKNPRRVCCNVGERPPIFDCVDVVHGGLGGSNCGFEGPNEESPASLLQRRASVFQPLTVSMLSTAVWAVSIAVFEGSNEQAPEPLTLLSVFHPLTLSMSLTAVWAVPIAVLRVE